MWFTIDGFYKDIRRPIGICSSCKRCHCETTINTRNKENSREKNKLYMRKKSEIKKSAFIVNDLQDEIWMNIPFASNYMVSNKGRVKSLKWGKEILIKFSVTEKGYLQVHLGRRACKVHRLVAMLFIPNPNRYKEINHKDENKTNNNVENLEWCNREYNMKYGTWKQRRRLKYGY